MLRIKEKEELANKENKSTNLLPMPNICIRCFEIEEARTKLGIIIEGREYLLKHSKIQEYYINFDL